MATGLAQAQYKMDLSDVTYPKIEYLKMGNVGPVGQVIVTTTTFNWTKVGFPNCLSWASSTMPA